MLAVVADRAKVVGEKKVVVFSHTDEGLRQIKALRSRYGGKRRDLPQYVAEYDAILASPACSHRKRRTTYSFALLREVAKLLFAAKWRLAAEVLRFETSIWHNIMTDEGDAMVADQMSQTPARAKVDNTSGHVDVGTGWTGTTPKQNTGVNTPSGSPEVMDATYPKVKGAFGTANDNVTQYRATYEAGDLNVTGLDEAALLNNSARGSADCLTYGQVSPTVDVAPTDTLQVDWEITYVGA